MNRRKFVRGKLYAPEGGGNYIEFVLNACCGSNTRQSYADRFNPTSQAGGVSNPSTPTGISKIKL